MATPQTPTVYTLSHTHSTYTLMQIRDENPTDLGHWPLVGTEKTSLQRITSQNGDIGTIAAMTPMGGLHRNFCYFYRIHWIVAAIPVGTLVGDVADVLVRLGGVAVKTGSGGVIQAGNDSPAETAAAAEQQQSQA